MKTGLLLQDEATGSSARPTAADRLARLRAAFAVRYTEATARTGGRLYVDPAERDAFSHAVLRAYRETAGQPAILRRARMLECFAEDAVICPEPDDLLAGSQKFCAFGFAPADHDEIHKLGYARNAGHIIYNYERLLVEGVDGLRLQVAARRKRTPPAAPEHVTLDAFDRALVAFSRFVERHADASDRPEPAGFLRRLSHQPPVSFSEALQLLWLAHIFLHAENPSAAISFGRLDQVLWPFLERDLRQGIVTTEGAAAWLGAFFLRTCEGEESQNLAVGGVDIAGRDATNPLTLLILRTMRELRTFQPSLSVRLHTGSPPELIAEACELAATGTGQPGFINDAAAIPALMELGIPLDRARDYGIVGCYEATPQGDSYPNTVAGSTPTLPHLLVDYLGTETARSAMAFRPFLEGYVAHVAAAYRATVAGPYQDAWNHWRDHAPSPFSSVLMTGCLDRALPLESGGARYNLFGVNVLGLGTTVDSLRAIEQEVFERRALPLASLAAAVAADWPDEVVRRQFLALPHRYGTDSQATNDLASELSQRIARMVLDSRMEAGVRPYPAFFRFTADIWDHAYATPDGRRAADNLSYGCGPSSSCGAPPTAILASAAHVAHALCACGNPLAISLQPRDLAGAGGAARLQALVLAYFAQGGFHVHFNLQSADDLRSAKANPTAHAGLMIRISGLSARFVTLPGAIQDALIERAEKTV